MERLSPHPITVVVAITTRRECNSDGSGTFTYSASGTATGPYNGTFTETGTVTTDSSRNVIASSAHFTITSAQGTVTGSETIAPNSPLGTCGGIQPTGDSFIKSQDNYQATITTPSGNYLDQGNFSKLVVVLAHQSGFTDLNEQFNSSKTQTTLIAPTSKDQCKDDGWKNYPQFKNQGQCVSSVNHQ